MGWKAMRLQGEMDGWQLHGGLKGVEDRRRWLAAPVPLLRIVIIWDSQGVVEVALRQQLDLKHL